MDRVMDSFRSIARETSESVYIWDGTVFGKTEIGGNRNSVEYI